MSTTAIVPLPLTPPIVRRIRAYFAPVNRAAGIPAIFDPAQNGSFNLDSPPAPWLDLGWLDTFQRKTESKVSSVTKWRAGAPAVPSADRDRFDCFHQFCQLGKIADGGDSRLGANESAGDGSECARKWIWRNRRECGATQQRKYGDFPQPGFESAC